MNISDIIESQYKPFSYYVIESRAIPKIADGLKPVERRSLWAAKKVASKEWCKVSKLAGSTMSNHPHGNASIEASISSMAQQFAGANNVTFFDGKGTFGSKITGSGNGIASARYVSVKLSDNFYKYFDVDSDLIPLVPNYDETDKEPDYFLPIIPAVLLNPITGIAVGFACEILPRNIDEVKKAQIAYLQGKKLHSLTPYYEGFQGEIFKNTEGGWASKGCWQVSGTKLHISELPIGYTRESYVDLLDTLDERGIVKNYTDNCKDGFNFDIVLTQPLTEEDLIYKFKLTNNLNENITLSKTIFQESIFYDQLLIYGFTLASNQTEFAFILAERQNINTKLKKKTVRTSGIQIATTPTLELIDDYYKESISSKKIYDNLPNIEDKTIRLV